LSLTSFGISDFRIIFFSQNDPFFIEMIETRFSGETEPLRQKVARNGMVCLAYASAQRVRRGKEEQSAARAALLV